MTIDQSHSVDKTAFPADSLAPIVNRPLGKRPALHESELKYQRLVEGIGGDYIIYTHDPDGVLTYVSPSIENVLGYPRKAILGLTWRELIGEYFVGRDLADRVIDEVAAGKEFWNFTVEVPHADGSTRIVEIQQRPLFDSTGQYCSMEGIAKDITEATRSSEELQKLQQELEQRVADRTSELIHSNELLAESEARYRTVVECQTEFVVRWLPGAIFTFVNEAYCRRLGQTSDQLIGWCFLPTIHPEDRQAFQKAIDKLDAKNPFADFENRIILPDGSICWTHWTNQMLFDDNGNFLEFQSVGRDITELKTSADTIREKEAHLAYVSRLAMMGELVAGMAHEINQPLHAAKIFAEAARRNLEIGRDTCGMNSAYNIDTAKWDTAKCDTAKYDTAKCDTAKYDTAKIETAIDCTKEISNAISRTAKIIRRLREFTHSRPVKLGQFDLNQVVREASELIFFETRKAQVKLNFELPVSHSFIQGDRIQLEQACVNLLINAYEAMAEVPAAERQVSISTEYDPRHVRLLFHDSGCGTTVESMDQLFDAFYSTKQQGMGMGLSLCKSIAEAHGGRIWAQRNEGSGMTFVLELPTAQRRVQHAIHKGLGYECYE